MGKTFKSGEAWIVELDEAGWYSSSVDQSEVILAAERMARSNNCAAVSIFVIPDILFSLLENKRKHRVYQKTFDTGPGNFKVTLVVTGEIDQQAYNACAEKDRMALVRTVRDAVNHKARGVAGRYLIKTSSGVILEQGRV